jgi:arginine-tRNA-protein transferase
LAANEGEIRLKIGRPSVTNAKMELYGRFHEFQHGLKGWPKHGEESPAAYSESFVENPFPTEEWCYYLGEQLVGVGYVDALPDGLSAIYFFYDPDLRDRSLGTFNVLRVLREAARRRHSHVYLGYFVEGCRSLEYKGRFRPNEVILPDGTWVTFRD